MKPVSKKLSGHKKIRLGEIDLTDSPDIKYTSVRTVKATRPVIENHIMSAPAKTRPEVPEGVTEYVTTRQMKPNEKGFVGYETTWKSFQKEAKYETPKKP